MTTYTYRQNGAKVTDVNYAEATSNDPEVAAWRGNPLMPVSFEPLRLEIYNAKARLPDIVDIDMYTCFFSERVADVFRQFQGDRNVYLKAVAYGKKGKDEVVEVPYYSIYPKTELDCVDEAKSLYIARERPRESGEWIYDDLENLVLKEEVIAGHHHFRIKGWSKNSFISEELAKALKAIPKTNLKIETIEEVFRTSLYNGFDDPMRPRNLRQSMFYLMQRRYVDNGWVMNYRRRNKNDP